MLIAHKSGNPDSLYKLIHEKYFGPSEIWCWNLVMWMDDVCSVYIQQVSNCAVQLRYLSCFFDFFLLFCYFLELYFQTTCGQTQHPVVNSRFKPFFSNYILFSIESGHLMIGIPFSISVQSELNPLREYRKNPTLLPHHHDIFAPSQWELIYDHLDV